MCQDLKHLRNFFSMVWKIWMLLAFFTMLTNRFPHNNLFFFLIYSFIKSFFFSSYHKGENKTEKNTAEVFSFSFFVSFSEITTIHKTRSIYLLQLILQFYFFLYYLWQRVSPYIKSQWEKNIQSSFQVRSVVRNLHYWSCTNRPMKAFTKAPPFLKTHQTNPCQCVLRHTECHLFTGKIY